MPSIGYNLNIPAANNNPSQDQPKMQTNTNAINTLLSLDHFTFADGQAGRHKQVTLTNEAAPGLNGGNGVLYANAVSAQSQPFWQNSIGSFQIPIINAQSIVANGYRNLSGLIMQWGSTTAVSSSSGNTITFPIPFPSAVFTVQATVVTNDNSTIRFSILGNATLTGFSTTQTSTSHFIRLYWFAVGN